MSVTLDLADIQGNILTAYGRLGFPKGRFLLFNIQDAVAGRAFVEKLRHGVTTALRWPSLRAGISQGKFPVERPLVTANVAFSFYGLIALGLSTRSLRGFPDEFMDGMPTRARILGDDWSPSWAERRDPLWSAAAGARADAADAVHMLVTLNAQMDPQTGQPVAALDAMTARLRAWCAESDGKVRILSGHRGANPDYQDCSAIMTQQSGGSWMPVACEHFGYADGISDPVFDLQFPNGEEKARAVGGGKIDAKGNWIPLATGEFLLGHPDEAQETPGAAMPLSLSRNGTFLAYRKLHQNVVAFRNFITSAAERLQTVFEIASHADACALLMAKIAGRWEDGVPLEAASTIDQWQEFNTRFPAGSSARDLALTNFHYSDDTDGAKCPFGAHIRRGNTRDMLGPTPASGSALANRRRILRRGLPYGLSPADTSDDDEHGIVMLNVCASLFRQFEFVQQQWINYGLDFNVGNDTCPLVGNHAKGPGGAAKFVIAADPKSGHGPFVLERMPQFVELRGGEYFFIPSMTALRMIGMGVVDPT